MFHYKLKNVAHKSKEIPPNHSEYPSASFLATLLRMSYFRCQQFSWITAWSQVVVEMILNCIKQVNYVTEHFLNFIWCDWTCATRREPGNNNYKTQYVEQLFVQQKGKKLDEGLQKKESIATNHFNRVLIRSKHKERESQQRPEQRVSVARAGD